MRAFAASLAEPLNPDERRLFDATYAWQDGFGGLPLVLLRDRFEWLREGVLGVRDSPADSAGAGALLRLLEYYGTMVRTRRRGDTSKKAAGKSRTNDGRPAAILVFDDTRAARPDRRDRFQELVAELLDRRGVSCPCGTTSGWHANLSDGGNRSPNGPVLVDIYYEGCDHSLTLEFSEAEFRSTLGASE